MVSHANVEKADGLKILDTVVDTLLGVALIGELGVVMANVLGRAFLNLPLLWSDEISNVSLSIIAFLGGAIAYRREQHIFVRTIVNRLPDSGRMACYAGVDWLVLAIALFTGYHSLSLLTARWDEIMPILRGLQRLAFPVSVGAPLGRLRGPHPLAAGERRRGSVKHGETEEGGLPSPARFS
jgi:TRAP-type C4-dicarboxylate transport system permease small subunit